MPRQKVMNKIIPLQKGVHCAFKAFYVYTCIYCINSSILYPFPEIADYNIILQRRVILKNDNIMSHDYLYMYANFAVLPPITRQTSTSTLNT